MHLPLLNITMDFFAIVEVIDRSILIYIAQCIATTDSEFHLDILLLDGDMRRPSRRSVICNQSM